MSRNIVNCGMEQIQGRFGYATQPMDVGMAIHEAAHAVMALALGHAVSEVSTVASALDAGHIVHGCLSVPQTATVRTQLGQMLDELLIVMAGPAAEEQLLEYAISSRTDWSGRDNRQIADLLARIEALDPGSTAEVMPQLLASVRAVLNRYWSEIDELASALLVERKVDGMPRLRRLCPQSSAQVAAAVAA